MPAYNFVAGTKTGKTTKGVLKATDITAAAGNLRQQGLFILSLKKKGQIGQIDFDNLRQIIEDKIGNELSAVERIMFTTHLASMLKTGVPIIEAISAFVDKKGKGKTRRMLERIIADLESGKPLSRAFSRFPKTFSPVYTHIVASGESTGTLGETLSYLAEQLNKDHRMISRVKGAMIYPAVIVSIMLIVLSFITFSVIPKLLTFTQNINQELPLATSLLISITSFLTSYGIFLLLVIGGLIILLFKLVKTKQGREFFDKAQLKLPLAGQLVSRFNLARFSRLLGAFYHYAIPLPTAFIILESSLSNTLYRQSANRLSRQMSAGSTLSDALDQEDALFPKIMVRVVRSAEKSATVDDTLWRLADYYEAELDNTLKNLTTLIEPVLILILGLAITGIALAVIVPIYQITISFQ